MVYVEDQLDKVGWNVDFVLSHTTPLKYEPVEVFMKGVNQEQIDKSTEQWLDAIEDRLDYKKFDSKQKVKKEAYGYVGFAFTKN